MPFSLRNIYLQSVAFGFYLIVAFFCFPALTGAQEPTTGDVMSKQAMPPLTPEEEAVILHKATERPGSGAYLHNKADGTYVCRHCGTPLYAAGDKFESGCGWPAFDDALPGAVRELPDPDGRRVEIVCANCGGHLGHVFRGEGFTAKNTRHCVNSLSLHFNPEQLAAPLKTKTAVFAGGCFWGVEHVFAQTPGVLDAESGYTGGSVPNPSYEQVCSGQTGHAEAVKVTYDPAIVSYEELARLFFELHDPTQLDRQGPDFGTQYRSAIYYADDAERQTAERIIGLLKENGYKVVTEITPVAEFYPAEDYHQDYFAKRRVSGCHFPVKRFERKAD